MLKLSIPNQHFQAKVIKVRPLILKSADTDEVTAVVRKADLKKTAVVQRSEDAVRIFF